MKMNQKLAACGIAAALFLGAGNVSAQNDNGGPGGGFRNMDAAQMQQLFMDNIKDNSVSPTTPNGMPFNRWFKK